ncbi:MAG: AtpZ/AtpI family protein [Phaeodactylibacter sp.]|uniref:AtpZ/AtpI family protein n=1 Tax=Phaeodactylibacter TaxID=1564515 RepID=UPI0024A992F9|nr:AtpZ/AtpI family protein [Phaeodactylibacter xiamenensis]
MNPIDKKHQEVLRQVSDKARRKRHAQREEHQSVWGGLGMFGLIGWSVVVPTLAGAGLGIWLDQHHPQSFSWTLSLLILGLFAGCLLAWQWVNKEHDEINKEDDE